MKFFENFLKYSFGGGRSTIRTFFKPLEIELPEKKFYLAQQSRQPPQTNNPQYTHKKMFSRTALSNTVATIYR